MLRDPPGRRFEILEVRGAPQSRRRAHSDKDYLRARNGGSVIRGEFEVASRFRNELRQIRLVERHFAALEGRYLAFVRVNARNLVSQKSKTSSCGKTDVAGAEYGNVHIPYLTTGSVFDK